MANIEKKNPSSKLPGWTRVRKSRGPKDQKGDLDGSQKSARGGWKKNSSLKSFGILARLYNSWVQKKKKGKSEKNNAKLVYKTFTRVRKPSKEEPPKDRREKKGGMSKTN